MNARALQRNDTVRTFVQALSATRRAARLARLLTTRQLEVWDVSPGVTERAEQIVAELASNAVLHGRVPGRDFRLTLALDTVAGTLRIGVTDARADRVPVMPGGVSPHVSPRPDAESGRGLVLVAALADRSGVDLSALPLKTVWAELDEPRPPLVPPSSPRAESPQFTIRPAPLKR